MDLLHYFGRSLTAVLHPSCKRGTQRVLVVYFGRLFFAVKVTDWAIRLTLQCLPVLPIGEMHFD